MLDLQFPDSMEEARQRGEEFQRLPPDERLRQIAKMHSVGMALVRASPDREKIEMLMLEEENQWQEIQRELLAKHG